MTFDEFWAGFQMEGKSLNPVEVKLACHLAWANAKLGERERIRSVLSMCCEPKLAKRLECVLSGHGVADRIDPAYEERERIVSFMRSKGECWLSQMIAEGTHSDPKS